VDKEKPRRFSGRIVVLVTVAIVFGGFGVSYLIYVNLNPPADLFLDRVADCRVIEAACLALNYTVLDDGSVANLTILWRVLDAWDHPENYARAVRSGENLTYHTSRAAASQLVGFLEHRLAQENEDLVVDGSYTGPVLLRHRDPDHDAVFRLSWA